MELEFRKTLDEMQVVSQFPQHNTFGILQPMIVAPGEPDRSVMIQRVTRRGSGQMPPLVSNRVDERGSSLLREWIASLQSDRKFVKEWTAAEILEQLNKPDPSRSAESGKKQFEKAGCIQCHRVGETGGGVGPNLTGIGQRATVHEIVESIVTPSAKIPDAYASRVIVTLDGNVFQGRIEAETNEFITLRSNDSFSEPTKILKADIEEQSNSTVSSMPVGTINYLDLDEILDLIAYLTRSGDRLTE
jgi:putative heme-binding domain-containing protein